MTSRRSCWDTGAVIRMCECGPEWHLSPCLPIYTDGRNEWVYCPTCKKTWDVKTMQEIKEDTQ